MTIYTFVPHNIYYCTLQNVLSSTLKDTLKIVCEHFREFFVNRLKDRDKQQVMLNEKEEFSLSWRNSSFKVLYSVINSISSLFKEGFKPLRSNPPWSCEHSSCNGA